MKTLLHGALMSAAYLTCGGVLIGLASNVAQAQAQEQQPWSPPSASERCPSKWGAEDRRGSLNLMTPERAKQAAELVQTGEIVELGRTLHPTIPVFGTRRFDVHLKRTFMNPQANQRGSNEEVVVTELGQVGTQLDAFPHQTIGDQLYNCVEVDSIATRTGFTEMGVDTVGTVFTRGVLLDIAGLKDVETLPDSYEITVEDLEQALERQNVELKEGDAVLIHTGWGRHWEDPERYNSGAPGIGVTAAEWLIERNPILIGADNWPVEVAPSKTLPDASLPVHQIALVVNGVHLLENLKLDELAQRERSEFAFLMQPIKIKGGTGSTVAPVALF
ncbi:MAG TPA: cyclase family protein [Geminicoccaceae bacterium]|nr:cyclase family protein [Geminicoccaceae bacterium]